MDVTGQNQIQVKMFSPRRQEIENQLKLEIFNLKFNFKLSDRHQPAIMGYLLQALDSYVWTKNSYQNLNISDTVVETK